MGNVWKIVFKKIKEHKRKKHQLLITYVLNNPYFIRVILVQSTKVENYIKAGNNGILVYVSGELWIKVWIRSKSGDNPQ